MLDVWAARATRCRRNWVGVTPNSRKNIREKWEFEAKPHAIMISAIDNANAKTRMVIQTIGDANHIERR